MLLYNVTCCSLKWTGVTICIGKQKKHLHVTKKIQSTICTVTWRLFSPSLTVGLHFSSILLWLYLLSKIMFPTSVASLPQRLWFLGGFFPTLNTSICFPCGNHDGYQESWSCFAKKVFFLWCACCKLLGCKLFGCALEEIDNFIA